MTLAQRAIGPRIVDLALAALASDVVGGPGCARQPPAPVGTSVWTPAMDRLG